MKIASSDISMTGQHSYVEYNSRAESAKAWVGDQPPDAGSQQNSGAILQISEEAKELQRSFISTISPTDNDGDYLQLSDKDKLKIQLIEELLGTFLRRRIKLHSIDKLKLDDNALDLRNISFNTQRPQIKQGWGLIYDLDEVHYESEKMSFKADGVVKTADGQEIKIDVKLNMSREFMTQNSIHIRAGDAVKVDPLVINFGSSAAQLTDRKFEFDIDADGKADQISTLGRGSGFLSLDLNQDGKINDGSELFGPKSGNGFADLAAFDEDQNGWIDENDSVFGKLRIWCKDESGNDQLFALGQKGVGAIYLGNVDTGFELKDSSNNLNGQIQKTGIFLRENGTSGTIQHIDLAV